MFRLSWLLSTRYLSASSSFGDETLIAIDQELTRLHRASPGDVDTRIETIDRIVSKEMRHRWEMEKDRLTKSSPFYRLYHHDHDDIPW